MAALVRWLNRYNYFWYFRKPLNALIFHFYPAVGNCFSELLFFSKINCKRMTLIFFKSNHMTCTASSKQCRICVCTGVANVGYFLERVRLSAARELCTKFVILSVVIYFDYQMILHIFNGKKMHYSGPLLFEVLVFMRYSWDVLLQKKIARRRRICVDWS